MPRGLERAVKGMKLNEKKKVTVEAKDAYGKRDESLVMKFVRADLPENFVPVIGKTIKIQELGGTIVNVDEIHVFLDCNHPLAGKDVIFDIRVVGIE
jgi:peptidylprolyl isomerase